MNTLIHRLKSTFTFVVCLCAFALTGRAQALQYSTTWVGNTYGDNAHHVGNCARAIWVAPEGVVYTASLWDENAGGIGIYQAGQNLGSIGAHGEMQGCSIVGNATSLFACLQGVNGGQVGRYNRSSHVRELMFAVSASKGDSVPGLAISPVNGLLYASDFFGNRIRVFTTDGVWQQDWTVSSPGALAVDSAGNVWVAQMSAGTIQEFTATGGTLNTITMASTARPSALYVDAANAQLLVGDQGPDQNIKIYGNLGGVPTLAGTFGVQGGYLSTAGNTIKGTVGDKRFTRVVGLGKDSAGNLYVSHSCWGGTWDLGRNGATDIHCYNSAGTLQWTLQALNFEGNGVVDAASGGATVYNGKVVMTGSGGAGYVANTVDPFTYPSDARINTADPSRGSDFALMATVGSNQILMACGQNPDNFHSYYFNAANGYIAIPGPLWGASHERNGFCLDSAGNVWEGRDKTNAIWFNQLTGFDANGAPIYATATSTPTPASIAPLTRIFYLPASDTMILGGQSTDWTAIGGRIEVYRGWRAGNTTTPNTVITLNTALNPKAMAAAGNYLFVGYTHTVPNIDAFNLTTGALDITMTSSNPNVYVGNDVDSMYGVGAYQKANGDYVVTKDNYNGTSCIIHTLTTNPTVASAPIFSPGGGSYASAQSVTMTCATTGVSIRYTTDGSTPTSTTGIVYTAPVAINATTTLKAIAYESGLADSSVTSAVYTINQTQVAAPGFSPVAGTYSTAQSVTISTATGGASIRYTTDGSTPTSTTGTVYSTPVTISATTTLKAIAYAAGLTDSAVTSGTYTISLPQVAAPSYSPAAGSYTAAQSVTISTTTGGATIRYTTDGSIPTSTVGTVYSGPVLISATATLKAIAYESGYTDSTVTSGTYTINAAQQVAAPSFSPAAGSYTSAQSVTISTTTGGATIRYTTDGSTPTSTTGTVYSTPVTIGATTTLKAIAYESGYTDSSVASGTYTITLPQVVAPSYSPAAGSYTAAQSVTISTTTGGATIRYTTDGSTPTSTTGTLYSGPVSIGSGTTMLKAIAYESGYADSSVTSGTYTVTLSGGLPSPWLTQDVGAVGIAGSATYSSGTFTVNGSGSDINRTADQFRFVSQGGGSNCTVTARVVSMTNTNTAAKAGVMIRETLATGSTEASITVTPANGVTWQYRSATDGTTAGNRTTGLVAPYWVRLVRNGNTFTGYLSPDGVTWTQQGTATITMAGSVYFGLVVTSRDNTQLCTASFDNVTASP